MIFNFSMIRESIFYRPRENGFRFFVIREICISLRVICEPTTFAGILFQLFKDFSVLKARKLHHTRCSLQFLLMLLPEISNSRYVDVTRGAS